MVFTANKPLDLWARVLHDPDLDKAILDRILKRGRSVTLEGPSMRTCNLFSLMSLSDKETPS